MTDRVIRVAFIQMFQVTTTQSQSVTTKAQAMTAQANRQVIPRANQHIGTIPSYLRDFTRINPPTLYGSIVEEDPQDFIYETYKTLYAMGFTTCEKVELDTYHLQDVAKTLYVQWIDKGL